MMRALRNLVLLALVGGGAFFAYQSLTAQQTTASTPASDIIDSVTVERGELNVTVSGTGTVSPIRQVGLLFEASAPVAEILVTEGQAVKAGDVLARLNTAQLIATLEDARIGLQQQQVSYDALLAPPREADIRAAEAAVNAALASAGAASQGATEEQIEIARLQGELSRNQLWQTQLQRDQQLEIPPEFRARSGAGAESQEIQLQNGVAQAETQVETSLLGYQETLNQGPDTSALASANAQLVQAQISLDNLINGPDAYRLEQAEIQIQLADLAIAQAQAALDRAVLVAPFDGVIATHNLVVGELPPSNSPALLLVDNSEYYIDLGIDETDIVDVAVGQPVRVSLDALGNEPLTATVTRVTVTPTIVGQLVTYPVRVRLETGDHPVRAGMSATATITVSQIDDALLVPNRFVRIDRDSQQAFVTAQDEAGNFLEIPIELGLRNQTTSEVVSGLEAGQTLVLRPRSSFNPLGG